ncbi:uncharacterized protein LOC116952286 isoform X2 [Petromyzon marinus]|uniref:Uncharacterized protein LOC116952286 isoform X2 n=1 Tax=Petromyzon marinus TaxID=7757 RepID=A0AAJ7U059_PETMA|nr:uncharacterized protein LOC116952286 isoform X2 [Petromyzon marinus]
MRANRSLVPQVHGRGGGRANSRSRLGRLAYNMTPSERTEGRVLSLFCIAALLSATVADQACQSYPTPASATLGGSVDLPANSSISGIDEVELVYNKNGTLNRLFSWHKNGSVPSRRARQKYAFENATLRIRNIAANDTGAYEIAFHNSLYIHRWCFRLSIAVPPSPFDDNSYPGGGNASRTKTLAFISMGAVVCVLVMSAAGVAFYKSSRLGCKITSQAVEDDADLDTVYSTINEALTVEHIEIKELYSEVFQAKTNSPYEYAQVDGDIIRNAPIVKSEGPSSRFDVQTPAYDDIKPQINLQSDVNAFTHANSDSAITDAESPYAVAVDCLSPEDSTMDVVTVKGTSQL